MYCINVLLTVKNAADVAQVKEMMTEMGRLSRLEPGCVRYEVCHSQARCHEVLCASDGRQRPTGNTTARLTPFKTIYEPKVIPLVNREPHSCDCCNLG